MIELEQLENRIKNLPPEELANFRDWFIEFDHFISEQQMEAAAEAGALNVVNAGSALRIAEIPGALKSVEIQRSGSPPKSVRLLRRRQQTLALKRIACETITPV